MKLKREDTDTFVDCAFGCFIFAAALLFLVFAVGLVSVFSCKAHAQGYMPTPPDLSHPNTNSPQVSEWFSSLTSRVGHPCCGFADAYPAVIDEDAAPGKKGHGHIIDPSSKETWVNGYKISRPALDPPYDFTFDYAEMTAEKQGNPLKTALVFLYPSWKDGKETIGGIHCVVPLPPAF